MIHNTITHLTVIVSPQNLASKLLSTYPLIWKLLHKLIIMTMAYFLKLLIKNIPELQDSSLAVSAVHISWWIYVDES